MKIKNGTSNRGAVLLAELKALVDSFPHHQRAGVIKMLEIAFKKLNADFHSRHSVDQKPVLGSPSQKVQQVLNQAMNFTTKIKNEE